MKCRIVKIGNYYKGQILIQVPILDVDNRVRYDFEWHDIYNGTKYGSAFAAKYALHAYVDKIRDQPHIIEEFEL